MRITSKFQKVTKLGHMQQDQILLRCYCTKLQNCSITWNEDSKLLEMLGLQHKHERKNLVIEWEPTIEKRKATCVV